ncbi:MAG TPA: hypothetical protein DCM04_08145 [Saprospirales bacterium]|jgi:hypothetical protein|nr:hypothetical protein [Saprospirales bacterium]|tara:strand:+ start:115 stop:939 length:825 start_codon:yes stop_codon:yes gene_type:complete
MLSNHFYHERLRKSVAVFGALFNNIYVIRKNSSNQVISQVKVPLSYAPRRKFLERIRENADLYDDTKVAMKLPRMSFEITSISYDQGRQLQKTNNFQQAGATAERRNMFYSYVPYNLGFQLSIYAKNQDDALQVVEQVLPYFNPQYTLTLKPFAEYPDIKEDVPIALNGVDFSDDYEGALEQRRTILYTLSFDMRINFYGPILEKNTIRTAINNIYDADTVPTSDNFAGKVTVTPNPLDAIGLADSDFGFTTEIFENDNTRYVLGGYVDLNYFI